MDNSSRPSFSRGSSELSTASTEPRTLLFGEIPSFADGQSNCSNSSVCNLVLSTNPTFLKFWLNENCRNAFLRNVDRDTLPALRLVCHNFASTASPYVFNEITVNFRVGSFTKPGRMATLNRIGRHVKKFNFKAPHSADAFLPPILDPFNGEQLSFTYVPQVESPTRLKAPKYGSWEMDDVLIQQYPPIFHAATNIPSFIRAFSAMPNIEHISINSPDQNMSSKYRRSTADYCLVSLRIAIERAPLSALHALSLLSLHPSALLYLQPVLSYGSSPSSCRRWTQIRSLTLEMEPIPFTSASQDDHIRTIQTYMRSFSVPLHTLTFRWTGSSKGPSPLFLPEEVPVWTPTLGQYQYSHHHFHSHHRHTSSFPPITPPKDKYQHKPLLRIHTSPDVRRTPPKPLRFFVLRNMVLENCHLEAEHMAAFIARHRSTLVEFRFEDVSLRNGSWASTLEPLRVLKRMERERDRKALELQRRAEVDRREREGRERRGSEGRSSGETLCDEGASVMDVPCMMESPVRRKISGGVVGGKFAEMEEEPIIMETLEPQEAPGPWIVGMGRGLGVKKWFGGGATTKKMGAGGVVRHERKVSDHLKRVLNGGIFAWR